MRSLKLALLVVLAASGVCFASQEAVVRMITGVAKSVFLVGGIAAILIGVGEGLWAKAINQEKDFSRVRDSFIAGFCLLSLFTIVSWLSSAAGLGNIVR